MAIVSMKALLETGVHFGHRTKRWHPRMKPYIFTERNGIHILDLQQTIVILHDVYEVVRDTVAEGGMVLFVGTKRQAQDIVAQEAARSGQSYVNQRWLGGTLTNWKTIRARIDHLESLEKRKEAGEFNGLKKKEIVMIDREIDRLNMRLGGIRNMSDLPALVFVIDVKNEETAVTEANKMGVPIIAMVDSNCNPDKIDHVIPSNDDAIRAIKLITSKMADAALEGLNMRKAGLDESPDADVEDFAYRSRSHDLHDAKEEDLLGKSTLRTLERDRKVAEARREAPAVVAAVAETPEAPAAEETPAAEEEAAAVEEAPAAEETAVVEEAPAVEEVASETVEAVAEAADDAPEAEATEAEAAEGEEAEQAADA